MVVAMVVAGLASGKAAWAQNENETIGFQTNHVFESGQFGENIDVLNGGLNLTVPIGQQYQVNSRLGYGLQLRYSSKVWDTSMSNLDYVGQNDRVQPQAESSVGLGFTLNLGRITEDIHFGVAPSCGTNPSCNATDYQATWRWFSPDGSTHEILFDPGGITPLNEPGITGPVGNRSFNSRRTNDLTYHKISGPSNNLCPSGLNATQCFTVSTPEGLVYTLVPRVQCTDPPSPSVNSPGYVEARRLNQGFCGWYTALIEDRSAGTQDATTGFYTNYVHVIYDSRVGFEHAIDRIEDSSGRAIDFHTCEWTQESEAAPTPNDVVNEEACISGSRDTEFDSAHPYHATRREGVATYAVDIPAFASSTARYAFQYRYKKIIRGDRYLPTGTLSASPVLKLVRVDYPQYVRNGQSNNYSLYYGYDNLYTPEATCTYEYYGLNGDFGEVTSRSFPALRKVGGSTLIPGNPCYSGTYAPLIKYSYAYYDYFSAYLSGTTHSNPYCSSGANGNGSACTSSGTSLEVPTGQSRHIVKKSVLETVGSPTKDTRYCREVGPSTNPEAVTVTDIHGNDTIFRYHASVASPGSSDGTHPEDGWAPEWNDGTLYQTETYEGTGAGRLLVRTEIADFDADPSIGLGGRAKANVRNRIETTRYDDDGGRESTITRNDWDNVGHWRSETKVGFDSPGFATHHREYAIVGDDSRGYFLEGLVTVDEVTDGNQVLSRTDNEYHSITGRLLHSVGRRWPAATSSNGPPVANDGDINTTYQYYTNSGNVHLKDLSTGASDPSYSIEYTYAPAGGECQVMGDCGGYLATKSFRSNGVSPWKSIDRVRDTNTGLVTTSSDPAGVATAYTYDGLGRVVQVTPAGEDATLVDYVSLLQTTVTQGGGSDFIQTVYNYDGFGRKIGEARRSYSPNIKGFSCQTTAYDADNRQRFESEWFFVPAAAGCIPDELNQFGTKYLLTTTGSTIADPFGRVRTETRFDGKTVGTRYFGTSSAVSREVSGIDGIPFTAVTDFYRDGRNRLVFVHQVKGYHCSISANACVSEEQCSAGESCVESTGGGDASYGYDAADRLTSVDLDLENGQSQPRRFFYDGLGHTVQADNPENGTVVTDRFDALGHILNTRDAAGNSHRFTYDFAGRTLEERLTRAGSTQEWVVAHNDYDQNASGSNKSLGKVTTIISYSDAGVIQLSETRTYGEVGGRLSERSQSPDWSGQGAVRTTFHYDSRGELTSLTYPSETAPARTVLTVDFAYANGYATSATEHATGFELGKVDYNAAGGVQTLTTGGGTGRSDITFDHGNRVTAIVAGKPGSVGYPQYSSGTYEYDGSGNINAIGNNSYDYDASSRLVRSMTEYEGSAITENYAYDAVGNLTATSHATLGGQTSTEEFEFESFGAANSNRIITRQSGIGNYAGQLVAFGYDANGNLIQGGKEISYPGQGEIPPFNLEQLDRYEYSSLNRLVRVYSLTDFLGGTGLVELARYTYDVAGNRLSKVETSKWRKTYYLRDVDGKVLSEFRLPTDTLSQTSSGQAPEWTKDTIYLAGRILAIRENTRPAAPAGLRESQAADGANQWRVTLTWSSNSEPDVHDYQVYKKIGTGSFTLVGTVDPNVSGPTFIDAVTHPSGVSLSYRVTCRDTVQNESAYSYTVRFLTGDVTPPSITSLSAATGNGRVTLSYAAADVLTIAGYNIYRGTSPSELYQINHDLIPGSSFTDINLTNGITYYYKVQAIDASGNQGPLGCGNFACPVSAVPKDYAPPIPPRGLSACSEEDHADRIVVSWDPNPTSDQVVSYRVFRNTVPVFSASNMIIEQSNTVLEDGAPPSSSLAAGAYYYMVEAVDSNTPANISSPSVVTVGVARDPAGVAPVTLAAAGSDGKVSLIWADAVPWKPNYAVYRKANGSSACYRRVGETAPAGGSAITFIDGSVENNAAYDYVVTSIDGTGRESPFSKRALGIPLATTRKLYQCTGIGLSPYYGAAIAVQWDVPASFPYHPIQSSTYDGHPAYLSGYHLYHHAWTQNQYSISCNGGTSICTSYPDVSTIRQVLPYYTSTEPSTPALDPYRLTSLNLADQVDPEFPLYSNATSPPFIWEDGDSFESMMYSGAVPNANCVMPKAVYKVYAEGTWLTVESDWPEYYNSMDADPFGRCNGNNLAWNAPSCTGNVYNTVPAPAALIAYPNGPGDIRLDWTPPTLPAGSQAIAGYYVYATDVNQHQKEFRRPLPVATVPGDVTGIDLRNLTSRLLESYRFSIESFDSLGKTSVPVSGYLAYTASAYPGADTTQPGVPRSLHTVIWTLNDAVHERSRRGIKVAWQPTRAPSGWGAVQGFRVYRRPDPSSPWCAMLQGTQSISLPEGVIACSGLLDPPSGNYSATPDATYFFDKAPVQGQVYFYRVTELRLDNNSPPVVRETPLEAAEETAGRVLPYKESVLPPPQTFKAWAPAPSMSSDADAKSIALRWCPIPQASAPDSLAVGEYRVYRRPSQLTQPFVLLAKIAPACLASSDGQPTSRCVITTTNNCLADPLTCTAIQPVSCTGRTCMILDSTFNNWPDLWTITGGQHAVGDYTYFVTAVGTDLTTESLQSVQNEGWLNYCLSSPCKWRREPEGDSEFLWRKQSPDRSGGTMVCGDEDVRLVLPQQEVQPEAAAQMPSEEKEGSTTAPYRVIGQAADIPYRFLFYHSDHLGSPRLILTSNGEVETKHHYLPFGDEDESVGDSTLNSRGFTGHEQDPESGLDYMLARYYSSSLGRFMEVDPSRNGVRPADPQSWNRYAYVRNNPLSAIDPDGQTDIYVFRPEAHSSGKAWSAIQAEAGKYGNTVKMFNGNQATVKNYTDALSKKDAVVVFDGHTVTNGMNGPVGSVHLNDGDVGTVTAPASPAAATSTPSVGASTVGLFGCDSDQLASQYSPATVTGVNGGDGGKTSLSSLDAGAAAYTDAMARNQGADAATGQATTAIQKSDIPMDKDGDKATIKKPGR